MQIWEELELIFAVLVLQKLGKERGSRPSIALFLALQFLVRPSFNLLDVSNWSRWIRRCTSRSGGARSFKATPASGEGTVEVVTMIGVGGFTGEVRDIAIEVLTWYRCISKHLKDMFRVLLFAF